jgi:hypothetical protein
MTLKMKLYRDGKLIGAGWFAPIGVIKQSEHGTDHTRNIPDWMYVWAWRNNPTMPWHVGDAPKFDTFTMDEE